MLLFFSLNLTLFQKYLQKYYHQCQIVCIKTRPDVLIWIQTDCKGNQQTTVAGRVGGGGGGGACRVITNGNPEGWIFLFYPHMNNGFFFLLTTVFF